MPSIAPEALGMSLLFQYGATSVDEIRAWADSWIIKMDTTSDVLLQLSTTLPNETVEISSCLGKLSAGADIWQALRKVFPPLLEIVSSQPHKARVIASHLFSTGCKYLSSNVPEDLHFIYRFDDTFSLAADGIYGDSKTVYQEFIRELSKFSK